MAIKALEYISRYAEYKRAIHELARKAAVLEVIADKQDNQKIKKEALQEVDLIKSKIGHLMALQEEIEKTVWQCAPQDKARILRLHYFNGESFREIARNHNRKTDFIKSQHDEAMQSLQHVLDRRE